MFGWLKQKNEKLQDMPDNPVEQNVQLNHLEHVIKKLSADRWNPIIESNLSQFANQLQKVDEVNSERPPLYVVNDIFKSHIGQYSALNEYFKDDLNTNFNAVRELFESSGFSNDFDNSAQTCLNSCLEFYLESTMTTIERMADELREKDALWRGSNPGKP